MTKKAIIFGVGGQDGSYLADLLLEKGYKVVGILRRSSTDNTERIKHVLDHPDFSTVEGDITDPSSIVQILQENSDVDEIYNLAAQSHVGTSFKQPGLTWDITAKGCLNILQSLVDLGLRHVRFYQASSSEMFGASYDVKEWTEHSAFGSEHESFSEKYQNEDTKFLPQSPYAIAKCAAHYMTRLYREGYGIHASAGVLFNHECLSDNMPIIYSVSGNIHIDCISDFFQMYVNGDRGFVDTAIKMWDKNGWETITYASSFQHDVENNNKGLRIVNSRNSVYAVTNDHVCILEDESETESKNLSTGDKVKIVDYPDIVNTTELDMDFCEMLGLLVGDGHIKRNRGHFTNSNPDVRDRFEYLWKKFGGTCKYYPSTSGFTGEVVGRLDLNNAKYVLGDMEIYTELVDVFGHRYKKIPHQIFNTSVDCMEAFLIGYNESDGLKSNPCKYKFKNFKTNSPILAAGLLFLISKVTQQKYNITVEESFKHGKQQFYYSINLLSDRNSAIDKYKIVKNLLNSKTPIRQINKQTGISRSFIRKVNNGYVPSDTHHLELCSNEIKKIIDVPNYNGKLYDLETSSGTFHAGVGQAVVHNSPRRGENFVTRKITKWIGGFYDWFHSLEDYTNVDISDLKFSNKTDSIIYKDSSYPKLRLGNLEAFRDWGHAADYVNAMYMMLQQDEPDDYVICTGETHTVKEFLDVAFECIGISNWEDYVIVDPEFYRPAEVDYLRGDNSKAKAKLKWEPEHSFNDLVEMMVKHDIGSRDENLQNNYEYD